MPRPRVDDLTRRSQYAFQGTILKLAASTVSLVAPTERTAVVRVDHVLRVPPEFDDFTGREVTVALAASQAREGQRAVFFTTSLAYGESLALVEVGRMAVGELASQRKQMAEVEQAIADDALRDRLRRAQLVLLGRVVGTEPARPRRQLPITEHAPEWWEATLEVQDVVKGRPPGRELTVLFPRSTDEMWIESPKLEPGQEGIWLLQRNQKERGWPLMRVPGLTALHPLDYQPKRSLRRIRALLEGQR